MEREGPPAGEVSRDVHGRRPLHDALLKRIERGRVRVGIIGLGYVGLPLARAFSDRGIAVLGFDVDPAKVDRLERGESYIGHISDGDHPPDARDAASRPRSTSAGWTSPTSSSSASRRR